MVMADAHGLPLAVRTAASPHEVTLVEAILADTYTVGRPRRLTGVRAYDSNPLDQTLAAQGIELVAPHRRNWKRAPTQDGQWRRHGIMKGWQIRSGPVATILAPMGTACQ
jgi:hypothetical protein